MAPTWLFGKIDEATYDVGASYIVVDTGPWIFGKKVMLPAGVIDRVDVRDEKGTSTGRRTTSRTRLSSATTPPATTPIEANCPVTTAKPALAGARGRLAS